MILDKVNEPKDLKELLSEELIELSSEIREILLEKLSQHGGHIGPNLGLVELIIALHSVFESPIDKIVYDVSHQSYVHKILTGRKQAFLDAKNYDDVSGYSNPDESSHDFFTIGHTSTSISLASGLAKARDLKNEKYNVIALIGDGSLSGGEAFEALNYVSETKSNMIVLVNDNEMSIAENHGGLYENLALLRQSKGMSECNYFKTLGFDYLYVENGHDIDKLIETFKFVKDSEKPVVIHVHTNKGQGYVPAENDKETWHWNMPFELETGQPKIDGFSEDYDEITVKYLLEQMKTNPTLVAITSGTPVVFGFNKHRRAIAGKQFVDVGIAEEHAVALASGIAANGAKPVYGVYSTFLQRTYDQLSQDLCINNNPAVLLVFGASIYGMNDVTHLGLFDIAMMSNIPNMVYLAPTSKEEYLAMMEWGIKQTSHPVAIRVPANGVVETGVADDTDYYQLNKYKVCKEGRDVALIALGDFYSIGEEVVVDLAKEGINATLINPKFITGVDEDLLEQLKENHQLVVTLEDGILEGGFSEKITRYYGTSKMKVMNYGFKKTFLDRYQVVDILKENRITKECIIEDISNNIK